MNLIYLWTDNIEWWRYVGLYFSWVAALCLPYGERTPYWLKAIVGCTFSLPLLFIGLNPFMAAVPVVFIVLFWLSNKAGFFASLFVWKIVEALIGMSIGVATAYFVKSNEWLMIACMGTGLIGFTVGGTGFKPARRFIMPFVLTVLLWFGLK